MYLLISGFILVCISFKYSHDLSRHEHLFHFFILLFSHVYTPSHPVIFFLLFVLKPDEFALQFVHLGKITSTSIFVCFIFSEFYVCLGNEVVTLFAKCSGHDRVKILNDWKKR